MSERTEIVDPEPPIMEDEVIEDEELLESKTPPV